MRPQSAAAEARGVPGSLADVAPAKVEGHELSNSGVEPGSAVEPRDVVALPFAERDRPASGSEPVVLPSSFLSLSVLDRIAQPSAGRDLTLLYAVLIVVFLHAGALVGAIRIAESTPSFEAQGQVDTPGAVAVELVEAPDAHAKDPAAQIGADKPPEPVDKKKNLTEAAAKPQAQPEPPQEAQAPQQASKAQPQQQERHEQKQEPQKQAMLQPKEAQEKPEQKEPKDAKDQTKPKEQTEPKEQPPAEAPLKLQQSEDGTEAPPVEYSFAAGDPAVRVSPNPAAQASEAREAREARSPTTPDDAPNVAQKRLAQSMQGKESPYRKAVLKTLALSKPQIWMNAAEVRITFVVSPTGEPSRIRLLQSSKDPYFDDVALEWIKRAKFAPPPPGAKPDDLVYMIHYTIH